MNQENKSYDLLIQGDVYYEEIDEIRKLIEGQNIEANKLETKAVGIEEYIQLIFRDFNPTSFSRDFILSVGISRLLSKIHPVVEYFRNKKKKIKAICLDIDSQNEKGENFYLSVVAEPHKMEILIKLLDEQLSIEELRKIEAMKTLHITLDEQNHLSITII
ncbi:hypothetical protein Q0590_36335 [Rhodocytophaga aerolata]|uniref:Uncharacterized protein n=1 Tax=Rhodocytophaga aerolata TaxID=455078 RepID=A0ABT8RI90_9BACT|nr:hypothetical protein [Rhodocytophaga aerolata]MDO1451800.1 hypothetical protein [Rhodocytophaga aerolata]